MQFKKVHAKTALMQKRMLKEAYAANTLMKIVRTNDYDGLNNVFSLYMVMKQEQAIAGTKYALDTQGVPMELKIARGLSDQQLASLEALRVRRAELLQEIAAADYYRVAELVSLMESGEQLEMMEGLDAAELRKVVDMFADIGFAEVQSLTTPDLDKVTSEAAEVLRQTSLEPAERAKDSEAAKWLKKFAQEKQRKLDKTADEFRE